jgi:hypothetical protein
LVRDRHALVATLLEGDWHFKLTDKNQHVLAQPKAGHRCRRWMSCFASVVA